MDLAGDDPPLDDERQPGDEPRTAHDEDPQDVQPRLERKNADGDEVHDVQVAVQDPEDLDLQLAVPGADLDAREDEERNDQSSDDVRHELVAEERSFEASFREAPH